MLSALTLGLPFAKESVEGIICNTLKSYPQVRGNHSLRFIFKGKSLGALCSRALGHLHRFLPRVDVSCRTSKYQKIWLVETPIFFSFILWFHPVRRYVILFENICYFELIFIKHFILFSFAMRSIVFYFNYFKIVKSMMPSFLKSFMILKVVWCIPAFKVSKWNKIHPNSIHSIQIHLPGKMHGIVFFFVFFIICLYIWFFCTFLQLSFW